MKPLVVPGDILKQDVEVHSKPMGETSFRGGC